MKRATRRNERQKTGIQLYFFITKILVSFAVLGFIIWGIFITDLSALLKTEIRWQIDKNLPISQQELATSLPKNRIHFNLRQIKQNLESHPWVAKVKAKRVFWNTIEINVSAQKIAMRWQNKDCKNGQNIPKCQGYISPQGELFIPHQRLDSPAVLAISANDKRQAKILYQDYQNYQTILGAMEIKSIRRSNIDQLLLTPNIKVILGYRFQQRRLENFKKIFNKLHKKNKKVTNATFDMRYPEGFALSYPKP